MLLTYAHNNLAEMYKCLERSKINNPFTLPKQQQTRNIKEFSQPEKGI